LNVTLKIAYVTESLPGNNTIYRASIYAPQALMYRRVVTAARQAGNTGGMISTFPDNTNAFGAFGQWTIPTTKLLPSGSIPCVPGDGTACLIAVISYNQQTLCGPFLYRNDVEGKGGGPVLCKDGNTMTTDLQMASHDILNAGAMTTDNLTVNTKANLGETDIAGTTTMNGPVKANGGMNVGGAMTVTGNSTFTNDVQMNGGTMNVIGLNANTVQAPNINTNDLRTNDMTVNSGSLTVDNDVNVNGSVNMQGGGSQILAGTVNAGEINTSGGDVIVGTMNVKNSMNVTGQINVTGTTLTADRMVANDCVEVTATGKKYGTCP
jgi:hypothetical protein